MSDQIAGRHISKFGWLSRGPCVLVYLALALPLLADFTQRQKITSNPRGVGAQFGNAVALSASTMVVGARFDSTTANQAGAAFVYVRTGTTWTQQAMLLASDGALADKFGYSVAISGDTIVVGAYNDDSPLSNAGSAYVFVRSGTTWTQQQKLTAGDAAADQEFGNAVAIAGNTIAVGEHFADLPSNSEAGAVYIFKRTGTNWAQVDKLVPAGGVILGDHFGESLAMSGIRLVVGAAGADIPETAAGSVYVFADNGASYVQEGPKISIPDGKNGDSFGFSVAIEGTTLVGGALQYTATPGLTAFGAAYVYEFNGANWVSQGRLVAADGGQGDNFGWSVAVSNNVIAVGARGDDTSPAIADVGSAYVFTRSGTTWTQQQKLVQGDPFNGDRFGASVALSFGNLVVGAVEKALASPNGQGAVYYFKLTVRSIFPDFDGDGKADISVFTPSTALWSATRSSDSSILSTAWGMATDLLAPADYDGDGKTDFAIFRSGVWFRLSSSDGSPVITTFGAAGDLPMPGDFDGDGLADLSVYRPSTGEWIRINSSDAVTVTVPFGNLGDIPLLGDFDGDGKSDFAVYRPSTGAWFIKRSSDSVVISSLFGGSADIPVPADYDGDGKTDIAVYRPSTGTWFIVSSSSGAFSSTALGSGADIPAPADYDGDGKADLAVFRPSTATWSVLRSNAGFTTLQFGAADSQPLPLFFVRQGSPAPTLAPTITTQPVSQTVTIGSSVTFTAAASGSPAATYQWRKNGVNISGATSATLTLNNVQLSAAGSYTVVATNSAGTATSNAATLTVLNGSSDFNSDGQTDVLWQNTGTGQRALWLMNGIQNGFTPASIVNLGYVTTDWVIAGTGDFNSDGQADILWQNTATGQRALWLMNGIQNGFTAASIVDLGYVTTDWVIAGTGDFNSDSQADILWQNTATGQRALWLMNGINSGFTPASIVDLGVVTTDWVIAGTGDFNADSQADILWQNSVSGQRALWLMNGINSGFTPASIVDLGVVPTAWEIAGTGDFNSDRQTDILWQNTVTGQRALWLMNGINSGFTPASIVDLGFVTTDWVIAN